MENYGFNIRAKKYCCRKLHGTLCVFFFSLFFFFSFLCFLIFKRKFVFLARMSGTKDCTFSALIKFWSIISGEKDVAQCFSCQRNKTVFIAVKISLFYEMCVCVLIFFVAITFKTSSNFLCNILRSIFRQFFFLLLLMLLLFATNNGIAE